MAYQQNFSRSPFYFLAFAFILFGASKFIMIKPGMIERCASYLIFPVLALENKLIAPLKKAFKRRKTVQELTSLVEQYQTYNEELLQENIALKSTAHYLFPFQEIREYAHRYNSEHCIPAHVIFKHFSHESHFYLLDKGEYAGIKPDMIAVYKNCIVGKITDVYPYYCKVVVITDPACKIAAACTATGTKGIHEGTFDFEKTTLEFVSHLDSLVEGDLIISQGEGVIFPHGFALGTIEHHELQGFHHKVTVKPSINVQTLEVCYIIQKGSEQHDKKICE